MYGTPGQVEVYGFAGFKSSKGLWFPVVTRSPCLLLSASIQAPVADKPLRTKYHGMPAICDEFESVNG